MSQANRLDFTPEGKQGPVVKEGEFLFAATGFEHGHINSICRGLTAAGATLKWVYDHDQKKVNRILKTYPKAKQASSLDEILEDEGVKLVAAAAIPSERSALGNRVMQAGKDYVTAKTPFTTLAQLEETKKVVQETGQKYMVYYSERLGVESAIFAGQLVEQGAIGRVIQVTGFGPHRLNAPTRPSWFFEKEKYGGIICDIGSHQIEQFLFYSGTKDAKVLHSKVANYHNPAYPELEDYGDATLVGDNGATGYFRVDWLTPDGLSAWGDGRMFIVGTEGTIELRKNVDVARNAGGNHLYLVNQAGEAYFNVKGKVGLPFFGDLILDCINRTEIAMTQEHALKAAELCLIAQEKAIHVTDSLDILV